MTIYRIIAMGLKGVKVEGDQIEGIVFADKTLSTYTSTGKSAPITDVQLEFLADESKAEIVRNAVEI